MENSQVVWILYGIVLILNFLFSDKETTAVKRHGTQKETEEINNLDILTMSSL